jgi:hypothetical protein
MVSLKQLEEVSFKRNFIFLVQEEPTQPHPPTISNIRNFQPKEKRDYCIKELVKIIAEPLDN